MAVTVNKIRAKIVLDKAFKEREFVDDEIGNMIKEVITGQHLTFRYILVNALLSKSTNEDVDPLSLQTKDTSNGAYDARTIGNYILVPFEQDNFPGGLGGSSSPFINNPARVPRLTRDNKVRKGRDKELQVITVTILEHIDTSAKAYLYLKSALFNAYEVYEALDARYNVQITGDDSLKLKQTILTYTNRLVENSCMGESCVLVVSVMEQLYRNKELVVQAHKTNESGKSSNEVGDIDVRDPFNYLIYSIEVKDKDFIPADVEHAIKNYMDAGLDKSMFIYGLNAKFDKSEVFKMAHKYGEHGHFCSVISIMDYVRIRLLDIPEIHLNDYVNLLLQQARKICVKPETIDWIKSCI